MRDLRVLMDSKNMDGTKKGRVDTMLDKIMTVQEAEAADLHELSKIRRENPHGSEGALWELIKQVMI